MQIKVYKMKIYKYDLTDSTNERAREYARGGGEMPALFIANGQTGGRGRRGRSFDSERGAGLYMTLLFEPDGSDATLITIRAAVALSRAIERLSGLSPEIKWVNDLTVRGKKLSGILAEGDFDECGRLRFLALGIGVNLIRRDFPEELSDIVTTLEGETGKRISPETLSEAFVREFYNTVAPSDIIAEYRRRSSVIGERVEVRRISGEAFPADVLDVTDTGALLVRHEDGSTEELISAEVSIRRGRV